MTARGMLIRQRRKNLKHFIFSVCLSLLLNLISLLSLLRLFFSLLLVLASAVLFLFSVLVIPSDAAMVPLGSLHHVGTN